MATHQGIPDTPDQGGLDAVSVPMLLAQAWRDRKTGVLQLTHGARVCEIDVRDGSPVGAESSGERDGFGSFLERTGKITAMQRAEVERVADEKACPEASAVLALRLLDAKALYAALREAARDRIADCFTWTAGQFRWAASNDDLADGARPIDLLGLFQDQLPRRWGTERLFAELMALQDLRGDVSALDRKVTAKLATAGAPAHQAIASLDGVRAFGQILGECAGDPLAAATLWVVAHTGLVRPKTTAAANDTPEIPALDFEVEVSATPGTATRATRTEGTTRKDKSGDKGSAMRSEIEVLLGQLADLTHYTALGLEEDASAADIKKAYFKAAKKYHPDALARLGLDDLKEPAAKVFARIAEAFETLSDADKKRAYDAGGSDEPQIDTARLAQAETSFRKGEILVKMGNFEGALEYLEPAVELWPEEPAYQALLGWALYKQPATDLERASQHLEIAAGQAPDDAVVLFRLGMVMRAAGENGRANELIARARAIEPSIDE